MTHSIHIKSEPCAPILVVALGPLQASVTLFFDLLPISVRSNIRVIFSGDPQAKAEIKQARAVIFVRSLLDYEGLIAYAKLLGVPMYHYCDDNFIIVGEESERYGKAYAFYTRENTRSALLDFAGCLLAVPNLIEFYRANELHAHLTLYPPIAAFEEYGDCPRDTNPNRPFTLSFFGGGDRRQAFVDFIVPAVKRLSKQCPVVLIAFGVDAGDVDCANHQNLKMYYPPYEPNYALAIRQFRHYAPDVMLHSSSPTRNNAYKNCNNIINGVLVGAAMICSRTDPYLGLDKINATLLADDNAESWYIAMWQLKNSTARLRQMQDGAKSYCQEEYSGRENVGALTALLGTCPPITQELIEDRNIKSFAANCAQTVALEGASDELAMALSIREDALREGQLHVASLLTQLQTMREKIHALSVEEV